ncbi:MAG: hypothetical protein ACRDJM_04865 [Actinomycetota bacterium]
MSASMDEPRDTGSETARAVTGFLLGLALGALVGLLAKRKPAGDGDSSSAGR